LRSSVLASETLHMNGIDTRNNSELGARPDKHRDRAIIAS
jgi:hypothetical protein